MSSTMPASSVDRKILRLEDRLVSFSANHAAASRYSAMECNLSVKGVSVADLETIGRDMKLSQVPYVRHLLEFIAMAHMNAYGIVGGYMGRGVPSGGGWMSRSLLMKA